MGMKGVRAHLVTIHDFQTSFHFGATMDKLESFLHLRIGLGLYTVVSG
jgi:hypothetical protein